AVLGSELLQTHVAGLPPRQVGEGVRVNPAVDDVDTSSHHDGHRVRVRVRHEREPAVLEQRHYLRLVRTKQPRLRLSSHLDETKTPALVIGTPPPETGRAEAGGLDVQTQQSFTRRREGVEVRSLPGRMHQHRPVTEGISSSYHCRTSHSGR